MKINSRYLFSLLMIVILILSATTNWYIPLAFSLAILMLMMIVGKMGNGIVLRESTAFLYVFTCLVMPAVGYLFYTSDNELAKVWVKFMPVPEDVYFKFSLPAIICFCLAITWPLGLRELTDEGETLDKSIARMREILPQKKNTGLGLIIGGLVIGRFVNFLPGFLQFFGTLFFFASFAGLLYIYFLPDYRYKRLVLVAFLIVILFNALSTGMFTIVAYMGITIYSFFLVVSKPSVLKKLAILALAVGFIIVLQNTKLAYRKFAWNASYEGSRAQLFGKLFMENVERGDLLIENRAFFSIYTRTNQGFNVALVMRRIPVYQPYDGGNLLFKAFASAFVPRFLWPDKPEAGGRYNMKYYAGYSIKGWSTNVGPLGEAYGSFGTLGGIVYMFFVGMFIRWTYKLVFVKSKKMPLLICWIPVLFFQITYSSETDTLQIMNSLVKSAMFVWIIYKVSPGILSVAKKQFRLRSRVKSSSTTALQ